MRKPAELTTLTRIIVKIGTSVLTEADRMRVSEQRVREIVRQIADLRKAGKEVVVVTSGAIGVGMGILGMKRRPSECHRLQAAAATGQGRLMQWYTTSFERHGLHAAQILLTRDDLENRRRYLNAQATLRTLLRAGVVPIINENDTVSIEEIRYGDNDILSAHVTLLMDADLLLILSDVDTIEGPEGPLTLVTRITPELEKAAGGTTQAVSMGGMRTKLHAAQIVMAGGIPLALANGRKPNGLRDAVLSQEFSGTWFLPKDGFSFQGRKRWLALTGKPKGTIWVDKGARGALVSGGRSLLASGVRQIDGNFRRGDLVSVAEALSRQEFARGICGYSHGDLEKILGLKSTEAALLLGRKADEVIHRDSLVITSK